jgi:transcription termination factor Rho
VTDTELIASPLRASGEDSGALGSPTRAAARRGGGLSAMVLPELRALAIELGIKGTSGMRKGDLIAAIHDHQGNGKPAKAAAPTLDLVPDAAASQPAAAVDADGERPERRRGNFRREERRRAEAAESAEQSPAEAPAEAPREQARAETRPDGSHRERRPHRAVVPRAEIEAPKGEKHHDEPRRENRRDRARSGGQSGHPQVQNSQGHNNSQSAPTNGPQSPSHNRHDDDDEGGRGRRGRRFRERRRGRDGAPNDTEIREDDVLQPVAGILDVLDNYAFVRTSGYLPGPNDVYVSMNLVRRNGLRRGDAITGAVRVAREGEQGSGRQKFNPLVRIDTVNGGDIESARKRPEFNKLTPLYPNQRLRLETDPNRLTTRVIDLVMPIGKGQRALIVSPPKAGKTTVIQDIANAIARNNPECHLMVVLVDERPEEVTDMQRSVKGEVIASTFDRPPSDHTAVAELAIERAKRLVEAGHDVVVLLDSITRLGRAYNNSSPASGRILSGGVDSTALYPPKRFLGAARNIENGGSLTIIATAMVETGSTGDTVIFEEFKGTGNAELKLDRKIAERRVFPAVDVNPSGTRKDELLMNPDEFAVVHKLRRVLSGLDSHQAIDLLIDKLRKTKSNIEFLMQVAKNTPFDD